MNRPIGDAILIGGVCLFASWTIFCYVMVFSGSGFSDLVTWYFVPAFGGVVLGALCIGKLEPPRTDYSRRGSVDISTSAPPRKYIWGVLLFVVSVMTLRLIDTPYYIIWTLLLCATIVVFRIASTLGEELDVPQTPVPNWQRISVIALVVFGVVLVAITHRSDLDDSQYLNFVVTALDFPFDPLYSRSGLWLDRNVPLELPIYRFHSYELLVAALSYGFGVDHKAIYYLVLPPFFGGVAILLHWRLAQHLMPRHALPFILAWLVLIIALGETHRSFGNFAFVRLYQGKALLVSVCIPMCLLLGLRFAETPDWRRSLALGMAAIASLGMSTSALVTVPVVVAAALAGGLPGASPTAVKRIIAVGLGSSVFLLAIGIFLAVKVGIGDGLYGDSLPSASKGLSIVLGDGVLGALVLALFPAAPLFVSNYRRKRAYAITTLVFVAAVMNPWIAPFLARMFDLALQWRLFWSVPLVVSAALSLVGLTVRFAENLPQPARLATMPMMLVAIILLSTQSSISPDNGVIVAPPYYKVEPLEHEIAGEIVRNSPTNSTIYAPTSIAAWITTFHQHPYPLIVRPDYIYFGRIRNHIGDSELQRRSRVINFLEGYDKQPSTQVFFKAQLANDRPSFVAYDSTIEMAPVIGVMLKEARYVGEMQGRYWLWQGPDFQDSSPRSP